MVNVKTSLRSLDGIDIPDNVVLKIYNSVYPKYDAGRAFGSLYSHITISEWCRFVCAEKKKHNSRASVILTICNPKGCSH